MKKKQDVEKKRLVLSKERVRHLDERQLEHVVGGSAGMSQEATACDTRTK